MIWGRAQFVMRSRAHSVGDPDLGDGDVSPQIHHPPVATVRRRPEAGGFSEQPIHCFFSCVLCMPAAG